MSHAASEIQPPEIERDGEAKTRIAIRRLDKFETTADSSGNSN
ncbi:hypothetical protein Skr01_03780 [Sphaerisporangium krabiense]|uniref:Uncharacterized protein n=1 Tax=Sphaerisporangium krabiense TaxID=763782 RepID=A0A7W9DRT0_9ACTN|nr:hypothetical protein [Sphaerisporangium krabiense]MBB5628866.1 hypothetical protein [Sphaerisporangium krabiense]GII60293.1 hypothetical protein Skr01_03780 [Sphaerisporangium krabiense]